VHSKCALILCLLVRVHMCCCCCCCCCCLILRPALLSVATTCTHDLLLFLFLSCDRVLCAASFLPSNMKFHARALKRQVRAEQQGHQRRARHRAVPAGRAVSAHQRKRNKNVGGGPVGRRSGNVHGPEQVRVAHEGQSPGTCTR